MDVEQMTECVRRAWLKHGVSWSRLSFDQRYEIIREYEAGRPPRSKPVAVKIPVRGEDGSSEGVSGGVGNPPDRGPRPADAPKTPGADQHATELMRQAHRELEGEYPDRGGRFDNKVR